MKTKLAVALFALSLPVATYAQIYDLNADWTDNPTQNPNGVWTYRAGATLMTYDAPPIANAVGVPGWVGPYDGYLPVLFKYAGPDFQDIHTGDVFVHTANDNLHEGIANVLWKSPGSGTIDLAGAAWFGADASDQCGRTAIWELSFNGASLSSGQVYCGDPYDRNSPFGFSLGSGGNQTGATDDASLNDTTIIQSGSIVIHK